MASLIIAQAEPSQYLCVVEHAAGLHYNRQTNEWGPQAFGSKKYVLRQLNDDDRDKKTGRWWSLLEDNPEAHWAFFEFGKEMPMPLLTCRDDLLGPTFVCKHVITDGGFDKDSRRFELVYHGGYISQGFWEQFRREHLEDYERGLKQGRAFDPSKPDDLFIEIGRCSPS
jgi:hypothetical protein